MTQTTKTHQSIIASGERRLQTPPLAVACGVLWISAVKKREGGGEKKKQKSWTHPRLPAHGARQSDACRDVAHLFRPMITSVEANRHPKKPPSVVQAVFVRMKRGCPTRKENESRVDFHIFGCTRPPKKDAIPAQFVGLGGVAHDANNHNTPINHCVR